MLVRNRRMQQWLVIIVAATAAVIVAVTVAVIVTVEAILADVTRGSAEATRAVAEATREGAAAATRDLDAHTAAVCTTVAIGSDHETHPIIPVGCTLTCREAY